MTPIHERRLTGFAPGATVTFHWRDDRPTVSLGSPLGSKPADAAGAVELTVADGLPDYAALTATDGTRRTHFTSPAARIRAGVDWPEWNPV